MTWTIADVAVGQVYESTDPRDQGRRVRVVWLMYGGLHTQVENLETGRKTYMRTLRLRPTLGKRGWKLVEDEA